jgi:hypothetical protein
MIQFESGLHRLINTEDIHDTYYKHLHYKLSNQDGRIVLQAQINYVTQSGYSGASVQRALKLDKDQLFDCVMCKESRVLLSSKQGWQTVYDFRN